MDREVAAMKLRSDQIALESERKLAQIKDLLASWPSPKPHEKSYDESYTEPTPVTISDFDSTIDPPDAHYSWTPSEVQTHALTSAVPSAVAEWNSSTTASSSLSPDVSRSSASPVPPLSPNSIQVLQKFARSAATSILSKYGEQLPPDWVPPSFADPVPPAPSPVPISAPRIVRRVKIRRHGHRSQLR
ncbi:uncharacterized protein CTRU02_210964 [Colletotrichum truncatum]|uniref:Uncharacterized protein n=1 Tax=Colletotrichum truncatum TaxID=5467 RepID=A0ACC3YQG0_COLTU